MQTQTGNRTHSGTAAEAAVAAFAEGLDYRAIPESALQQAKRLLLMGISWPLLGLRRSKSQAIVRKFGHHDAAGSGTVFGTSCKTHPANAAFLNATMSQVYDCNDGNTCGAYHAGRVLIPTAFAVAEHTGASGRDLLAALVVGYEIAHRASTDEPRHRSDSLGAAATAARLLGLSSDQVVHALRLSDQHGPHLYPGPGNFNSDANHLSNGMIARVAVESAFFAREGLTADEGRLIVEGEFPAGDDSFLINQVYIKPFIACWICHNSIQCALAFRQNHRDRIHDIEKIEVRLSTTGTYVSQRVGPGARFKTAQFSIPYTVACALLDGEVDEHQFTRIASADVQALQKKVEVQFQPRRLPAGPCPTEMTITLRDGRAFSDSRLHPKGSPANPLSDEELAGLFRKWASPDLPAREQIIEIVSSLETSRDVRDLTRLLHIAEP